MGVRFFKTVSELDTFVSRRADIHQLTPGKIYLFEFSELTVIRKLILVKDAYVIFHDTEGCNLEKCPLNNLESVFELIGKIEPT